MKNELEPFIASVATLRCSSQMPSMNLAADGPASLSHWMAATYWKYWTQVMDASAQKFGAKHVMHIWDMFSMMVPHLLGYDIVSIQSAYHSIPQTVEKRLPISYNVIQN